MKGVEQLRRMMPAGQVLNKRKVPHNPDLEKINDPAVRSALRELGRNENINKDIAEVLEKEAR